jgi:hypothetical protein
MTSQIITSTLDEDFPVAGVDNDSQGFRDNFSVIKNALDTAASEISELQGTTAKLGSNENNNFLSGVISNVQLSNAYLIAKTETTNTVNVIDSDYFRILKSSNQPLVINWPDNSNENYIKIRLEITATGGQRTIAFNNGISGGSTRANFTNSVDPVVGKVIEEDETGIFDCWIAGNSNNMFVQYIETFE